MILPKKDRFSDLLVEFYHRKNCHQNTNVMGSVRQKYWIPALRSLVRSIENKCASCKIRKAKPIQPQMGVLPVDRVTPYVRPFSYTGVDLYIVNNEMFLNNILNYFKIFNTFAEAGLSIPLCYLLKLILI